MPKFKIIAGQHAQKEVVGRRPDGSVIVKQKTYRRGSVVDTDLAVVKPGHDLLKMNRPGANKFEKVEEVAAPAAVPQGAVTASVAANPGRPAAAKPKDLPNSTLATLDAMTFEELKKFAEGEEIPLKGAKNKDEALKVLRTALA